MRLFGVEIVRAGSFQPETDRWNQLLSYSQVGKNTLVYFGEVSGKMRLTVHDFDLLYEKGWRPYLNIPNKGIIFMQLILPKKPIDPPPVPQRLREREMND